jgi:hypothetical protein
MSLIVFIPKADEAGRRLHQMIGQLMWQDSIEIFSHFKQLYDRLGRPSGNEDIGLFCASTPQDLDDLVNCVHLFDNLRLILILPDRENQTIAKGHLLRPRFMCYLDSDFSDLALVLKKMEQKTLSSSHSIKSENILPRGGVIPHPPSFAGEGRNRKIC